MTFPGIDWIFDAADPHVLAEAVGHAWVQQRAGGSVTVVDACTAHPWWPVLRAWLPAEAPLIHGTGIPQPLPVRPFPPVQLASLPRNGEAPWGGGDPWSWLAARESFLLLPESPPSPVHPAIAIALGAIASWGWRVVWCLDGLTALSEALPYIAARQLPLHLVVEEAPAAFPDRWWPAPRESLGLWLQHEWPTIHLPE